MKMPQVRRIIFISAEELVDKTDGVAGSVSSMIGGGGTNHSTVLPRRPEHSPFI